LASDLPSDVAHKVSGGSSNRDGKNVIQNPLSSWAEIVVGRKHRWFLLAVVNWNPRFLAESL
jgi:hypothetical protein